ncbi:hypothetical protein [Antarcticimicrobium luteum]|uniref:O-antigen ligase domain-containing protein n=1 Tax=Antarcticimicrobium luteum TaxID=2547397 RepID=A0A4R5VG98_9RHOB|nr:hypothetical protein [Antarcticimicrobium luteum]TDK52119.1 hypothetical protein E1832_02030 [Antarcticimicrobium luteum]
MPNTLASIVLLTWPLVCLVLLKRMPLERGLIWCILGGYLLLPPRVAFDLPLVPAMDKDSLPSVSAFLIVALVLGHRISLWPQSRLARGLIVLFLIGTVPTVLSNGDPALYFAPGSTEAGPFQIPGLNLRDLASLTIKQAIVLLPFLLGRQFLASETGLRELLLAMMVGGLIYSVPALLEVRLSPQFNTWIYGFFQHSFEQMMRDGGFRPIVFLQHALWLALFMVYALLSSAALLRQAADSKKARLILTVVYLAGVLFLCKSLASQLYALVFLPVILIADPRMQLRITAILALIAVTYPVLRNTGMIPLDAILERAMAINPDRAASLAYRFENEQILLDRAGEKTWFGWGGWGRNLLHDPESGRSATVPDGRWIIVFGTYGWAGYIAEMGLLALPLLLLWRRTRAGLPAHFSPYAASVAILLAVTMMDMLLNATLIPLTWMCAGALLGYSEQIGQPARPGTPSLASAPAPRPLFGKGPAIGRRKRPGQRTTL